MINVLALYSDYSGCGDYRVRFPIAAVNSRSAELEVRAQAASGIPADATFEGTTCRIRRVDVPHGVNVVTIQRPAKAALAGMIAWLRERRPDIGIVVELDDDLAGIPTHNAAHNLTSPKFSPTENIRWLQHCIRLCDVLTVSTPELAHRYGNGKPTFIVRNAAHSSMLDNPARALSRIKRYDVDRNSRIVGWAGAVETHAHDLQVTNGALADFVGNQVNGRTIYFRNVGPRDGVGEALGIDRKLVEASGWLDASLYRIGLGEIDVGIVPLADTRFNRSKSALKALEFAAAGVPVIASKLPEFEELRNQGLPIWLVKDRRKEWSGALKRILALDDNELRDLALAHREFVRRCATTEHRAEDWAHAWREAARIAAKRTNRRIPA